MGLLVEGVWRDEWYDTAATGGKFERPATSYRDWIEAGGRFSPEAGRYHLYVSWACPWAHRTLIYRKLKGLDDAIGVIYVDPLMLENGWTIGEGVDPINCARFLWQVYAKAAPRYTGRVSVPVLWDTVHRTIVNNELSEIIRMFDDWPSARDPVFRPAELAAEIDALNDEIYPAINNGLSRGLCDDTESAGYGSTMKACERTFSFGMCIVGDRSP